MRIPENAIIASSKLTEYLLIFRRKSDKSQFLAKAGFERGNPEKLEQALRRLIAEHEAVEDRRNEYGTLYQVEGDLHGPNGAVAVITVWLHRAVDGVYWFVTLKPAR